MFNLCSSTWPKSQLRADWAKTMDAFRDHGTLKQTLTADVPGAEHVLAETDRLGLDLSGVTAKLVEDGVKLFADAADTLLGAIEAKKAKAEA